MKLFAIYIGGEHPGANIEVHDMRFVVADTLSGAKSRAIKPAKGWTDPHRDKMREAEQAGAPTQTASAKWLRIHLTASQPVRTTKTPIGR